MATALKIFDWILEGLCTLFALVLGAIVALICLDVLLRNLGWGSLPWLIELSEYLLYSGTFLAAPWLLRRGGHVRVDVLLTNLPRPTAVRLEQVIDTCGLGISATMLWFGAKAVADAHQGGMVQYKTWYVPEWLLLLPIPIGFGLLAAEFVLRIMRAKGAVSDNYSVLDRPGL